jgi:UDP-3-O-[3-hydroxymyristoyl] N-acetylglucosamine deacetylase
MGTGLHTGLPIGMKLYPAMPDTGVVFVRTDLRDQDNIIAASYDNVVATMLGTTIQNHAGIKVATIEHFMSSLFGCGIDNVIVELDGPEVPIVDGSAGPFVFLLECAGLKQQPRSKRVIKILKEVLVEDGDAFLRIVPSDHYSIQIDIHFPSALIAKQSYKYDGTTGAYRRDIARARTFGFEDEVEQLRSMGLALGGSLDNAIVVGSDRILNPGGLRFNDEFVRHKILDCIGDISLAGASIQGAISGYKSGHGLNNKLLRHLFADPSAWCETPSTDIDLVESVLEVDEQLAG